MARDETPPFQRGWTWYNNEIIDPNNLGAPWLEGKEWKFEDTLNGTGLYVTCRVVRNVSGVKLYGSRLASYATGFFGRRIAGYTATTNAAGYPIDEAYAVNGVANNDLCYLVVEGPCKVLNGTTVSTTTVVAEGDPLSALTSAASTAASTTDAGRMRTADFSGATTPLAGGVLSVIGKAMSAAATSGVTNTAILCYITKVF
jgi:hypothetical protein